MGATVGSHTGAACEGRAGTAAQVRFLPLALALGDLEALGTGEPHWVAEVAGKGRDHHRLQITFPRPAAVPSGCTAPIPTRGRLWTRHSLTGRELPEAAAFTSRARERKDGDSFPCVTLEKGLEQVRPEAHVALD